MPKKQKNAFYFFMVDFQEKYKEENGQNISLKEVSERCHSLYKNLSPEQKEKYEQKAKKHKNQPTLEGKLCSDGTVLAHNLQAEQERGETKENESKAIESMVFEMRTTDQVADRTFYIVCFNVLCGTDDNRYIPNEVGVVKYSIRRGIEESYHCFIDPGLIPMGYTHASKQHSEDTHNIPISGFELANKDYNKICNRISEIVTDPAHEKSPVFCLEESLEQNRGCLHWLERRSNVRMPPIHFYDLTCLLMELRAYVHNAFPSRANAVDLLSNHAFDYTVLTRCDYHEELDNAYCALGYAKRLCFMLSDALCPLYGIECTRNHLPPRVGDTEVEAEVSVFPSNRTTLEKGFFKPLQRYAAPINSPLTYSCYKDEETKRSVQNSGAQQPACSWINEFSQPQRDYIVKKTTPPVIRVKADRPGERQPSTTPFVLNEGAFQINSQFALLGRGRGIGRGKQPPQN